MSRESLLFLCFHILFISLHLVWSIVQNEKMFCHREKNKEGMHIAIAGNIGSGKTTLTEMLARHFKWTAIYEQVDDNPYIANFYEDMRRWSQKI